MAAKIFRINYKSDFVLTLNSDAGWMTPFCIKFWTGAPSQAYYAGYDGTTYTNCAPVEYDPTKLVVQFDDHHLPIGDLKFQIGYHFTVADFPNDTEDEVINPANITTEIDGEQYQVMLDFTGETAPEIEFSLPAYANEAQRIANEEQRIAAETQRIANEETRIQHEESRIAAEQNRQQNEQQRINQEQARVEEYAGLKTDAVAATGAANDAAALANQKAQLAADKAALAQDASDLANAKAQLAADKAALAESAATLANQKAALAQQKAEYAQEQGTYSKNQGDYAKEQGDYSKAQGDYAKDQGDYSKSKGDYAKDQGDYSKQQGDYAKEQGEICAADHLVAVEDHQTAAADHQTAAADHQTATTDHNQAGNDHTRAESDHTRAESDHAAVEVYVDSLGAFDISAYHDTGGVLAKYADLTAALGTNGANIPDALRKGGMSIKFVQSSDNKYVQYRLMSDTFNTTVANWQGVDSEPVAGSRNLVESGGVKSEISRIDGVLYGDILTISDADEVQNGYYTNVGFSSSNNYRSYLFKRDNLRRAVFSVYLGNSADYAISGYASEQYDISKKIFSVSATIIGDSTPGNYDILIPKETKLIIITNRIQYGDADITVYEHGVTTQELTDTFDDVSESIILVNTKHAITDSGSLADNNNYSCSDFIPVNSADKLIVSGYSTSSYCIVYGYYNNIDNEGLTLLNGTGKNVVNATVNILDQKIKYVRVCSRIYSTDAPNFYIIKHKQLNEETEELKEKIKTRYSVKDWINGIKIDSGGTTSSSSTYKITDFIKVNKGDYVLYSGFTASSSTPSLYGYAEASEESGFAQLIPFSGNISNYGVYIPSGVSYIRACSRADAQAINLEIETEQVGDILTKYYNAIKAKLEPFVNLKGKRIAVIGDSIATGQDMNPYITVKTVDVGNSISAYITYYDIYDSDGIPTNKTIGGVALTSDMIGTLQTLTPVLEDVGKEIGIAIRYYLNNTAWPYKLTSITDSVLINASWSRASMCSGQGGDAKKLSYAWSDYSIGRCATRDDEGNLLPPDMVIICRGTNDMSHMQGTAYSVLEDYDVSANGYPESDVLENNTYSFTRAYILTIAKLRSAYPMAEIVCATVGTFKRIIYDRFPTRNGQYSLPELNDCIRKIANTMGCRVINFDKDGITFENCYPTYISDSAEIPTHPNQNGHLVMAKQAIKDLL